MLTSEAMGLQEHGGVLLLPQARVMSPWGRGHSAVPRTTGQHRERASTALQADELYQCSLGRLPNIHLPVLFGFIYIYIFTGSDAYVHFCTRIISG